MEEIIGSSQRELHASAVPAATPAPLSWDSLSHGRAMILCRLSRCPASRGPRGLP